MILLTSMLVLSTAGCLGEGSREPSAEGPAPLAGNANEILKTYKPALAVRGMSCLLCHAKISSSVVTDFGVGSAQSFVGSKPGSLYGEWGVLTNAKPLTLPWYGNYYGTWQLSEIHGTVVVPKATIADEAFLKTLPGYSDPSITLKQLLELDLGADYYGGAPYSGAGSMVSGVTPAQGNPKVAEIDEIHIGAPTAEEILALAPSLPLEAPDWQAVGAGASLAGLEAVTNAEGTYFTNSGPTLACKGDIVVNGTLLLNDVTIDTDNGGCRLYVTRSIFIEGRVRFTSLSGTQNLQLSSARAVLMGFDEATLRDRLRSHWYNDGQPLTRAPGTNSEKNTAILAEARTLGSAIHDANDAAHCPADMVTYEAHNGGGSTKILTQCGVHFERLLLNAPDIESRYVGTFKGVAISEIALFAPGALDFVFDPVFGEIPMLPALIEQPLSCVGLGCGGGVIGL